MPALTPTFLIWPLSLRGHILGGVIITEEAKARNLVPSLLRGPMVVDFISFSWCLSPHSVSTTQTERLILAQEGGDPYLPQDSIFSLVKMTRRSHILLAAYDLPMPIGKITSSVGKQQEVRMSRKRKEVINLVIQGDFQGILNPFQKMFISLWEKDTAPFLHLFGARDCGEGCTCVYSFVLHKEPTRKALLSLFQTQRNNKALRS